MNARILMRGLILVISLIALGYVLKTTELGSILDKAWIDTDVRGKGLSGELLFIAVGAAFTGLGLPRHLVSFLGGYAFGLMTGTVLALVSTTLGCIVAFHYARFLGRAFVSEKFPAKVRKLDNFLSQSPFAMTLLIRFLPVGSNLAVNLTAGVSGVGAAAFIGGSALGYIPQTFIFALMGSGINLDPTFRISLSVALFAVAGVIGVYLYRKYRHGKSFDDDIEAQLSEQGESESQEQQR